MGRVIGLGFINNPCLRMRHYAGSTVIYNLQARTIAIDQTSVKAKTYKG